MTGLPRRPRQLSRFAGTRSCSDKRRWSPSGLEAGMGVWWAAIAKRSGKGSKLNGDPKWFQDLTRLSTLIPSNIRSSLLILNDTPTKASPIHHVVHYSQGELCPGLFQTPIISAANPAYGIPASRWRRWCARVHFALAEKNPGTRLIRLLVFFQLAEQALGKNRVAVFFAFALFHPTPTTQLIPTSRTVFWGGSFAPMVKVVANQTAHPVHFRQSVETWKATPRSPE